MHQGLIDQISLKTGLAGEAIAKILTRPKDLSHGDYALPCFLVAKEWRIAPPSAAEKLSKELELPSDIEKAVVVGPYLNFFLKRADTTQRTISRILNEGLTIGKAKSRDETIVIDFSSPNIAKPFHVGHLRTTLIGPALYRIFKHLGYNTISVNHLGDWGTQFGLVWAGYLEAGSPKEYTIRDLVNFYIAANKKKKLEENAQQENSDESTDSMTDVARDYFLRLEANDPQAVAFWQSCLDVSLEYFKTSYKRLDIEFDYYQGESFYRDMLPDTEEMIKKSGILEDSRGALGVDLGKKLGFARIFTEDGRSLYITRDIACAIYRYNTFHPKKILYVVAAQQNLHFQHLIEILKKLKHPVAESMVHVSFGFVPGMKTRDGGAIELQDFIDEAHQRALEVYTQQVDSRPEGLDENAVAESVAVGAINFYFLSHSNVKDFNFRWEEALNFQGDSGPYIQYALARLYSIAQKAAEAGITVSDTFDASLLSEESIRELITKLGQFEEVLESVARDYEPYYLAQLLLDIARSVAKVYRELRVVGQEAELAKARLALFTAARHVLETGMKLLGIPAVKKM